MMLSSKVWTKNLAKFGGDYICLLYTSLAKEYGTPLYVMSETTIRDNCRMFTKAFEGYSGGGMPLFASKSFICLSLIHI